MIRTSFTVCALIAASLSLSLAAQEPPSDAGALDVPFGELYATDVRLHPCRLFSAVDQIARAVNMPMGFEIAPRCDMGYGRNLRAEPGEVSVAGMSGRQALDHLMSLTSNEHRWQEMDGVIVVRPADAWDDPANVLNRPTAAFGVTDIHVNAVLHRLFKAAAPSVYYPHQDVQYFDRAIDRPISVKFPRGTLLEGLNVLVKTVGGAGIWSASYHLTEKGELSELGHVSIHTLDMAHGSSVVGAPIALRPTRWSAP